MSYIGNAPISAAFLVDTFSGNGSTVAFTMTVAPANTSSIIVAITGVLQDPSTYSVSGTTLTFSAAPPSGTSNISVRYLGIPASGVTTTAYRTVTNFTATAGQTSFSVPSYTVGYIDVYRNGVRLVSTDFTATTGTTVVLNNACTVGDSVVTESFLVSSVLNAIPATAGSVSDSYIVSMAGSKLTGTQVIPKATLPTGSVLQVVNATNTVQASNSTTTYSDTNLTATITPLFATSKILVIATVNGIEKTAGSSVNGCMLKLVRNSTDLIIFNQYAGYTNSAMNLIVPSGVTNYLDSPATTSATTYKCQFRNATASAIIYVQSNNDVSTMTLMEIAA
jgi:hypothetical protein